MKATVNYNKKRVEGIIEDGYFFHNNASLYANSSSTGTNLQPGFIYKLKIPSLKRDADVTEKVYYVGNLIIRPYGANYKRLPKHLFGYAVSYRKHNIKFGCGAITVPYELLPAITEHLTTSLKIANQLRDNNKRAFDIVRDTVRRVGYEGMLNEYNISDLIRVNNAIRESAKGNDS